MKPIKQTFDEIIQELGILTINHIRDPIRYQPTIESRTGFELKKKLEMNFSVKPGKDLGKSIKKKRRSYFLFQRKVKPDGR